MYIVAGGRGRGKTTELLNMCIYSHGIFVVNTQAEKDRIKRIVRDSEYLSQEQKDNFKIVTSAQLKNDSFTRGRIEFQPYSQPYLWMDDIPEFDLYDWIARKKVLGCSITADEPFYEIVDLEDKINVVKPKKPGFFKRFKRWLNGIKM